MAIDLDEFVKSPTLEALCTKDHLLLVAEHFEVVMSGRTRRGVIEAKLLAALAIVGIFPATILPQSLVEPQSEASLQDNGVCLKELEIELRGL